MKLMCEHDDTLEIARRGLARLKWLSAEEHPWEHKIWEISVGGRAVNTVCLDHSKIKNSIREVGWNWNSQPNLDVDCYLFGGPSGAAGSVLAWVRGKEELTDEACMAIVLTALYGTQGGSVLYLTEVADGNTSKRPDLVATLAEVISASMELEKDPDSARCRTATNIALSFADAIIARGLQIDRTAFKIACQPSWMTT
jgi:hypothetical protein